ncbi:sensor histidine kinase [Agromyces subbeticus]|uniref:sensor histidine kinase n=1 Tax=Agromyces subbeticus TaxID=293890 RepID=UPI0003B530F3|nr:histidine kinase [Agromyces subbeticus]
MVASSRSSTPSPTSPGGPLGEPSPGEPPEGDAAHTRSSRSRLAPSLADVVWAVAIAAALLPITVVEVLRAVQEKGDGTWALVVIALFIALHIGTALRRRAPFAGLVIASAIMLALVGASLPGTPAVAVLVPSSVVYLVFVFTAATSGARRADIAVLVFGLGGAAMITVVAIAHGGAASMRPEPGVLIALAGFLVASIGAAWALGRYRLEFTRTRAARELAREQAAELRARQEREAAADDRRRLGRELHDVISHSLAVMVAQAEASRLLLGRDEAKARTAIEHVVSTGRNAMADMRGLVSVLAESNPGAPGDDAALAARQPSPDLADLQHLVARASGAGRTVDFAELGSPHPVSPGVGLTVYRVVQESLTNTLKHTTAPGRSEVHLEWSDRALVVTVDDDGGSGATTPHAPTTSPGGGRGIRGMRDRVEQRGGSLETGPLGVGPGWRTRATLPLAPVDGQSQ